MITLKKTETLLKNTLNKTEEVLELSKEVAGIKIYKRKDEPSAKKLEVFKSE